MNQARPSLFERAAEIYDFESGLPVQTAPEPLPPPRQRHAPVAAPFPEPVAEVRRPEPRRPASRPVMATVSRKRVELDYSAMAAAGLLVPDQPGGSLAEEMRLIKRRLLSAVDARLEQGDETARLVLIASGKPNEGKTFTALNLALSIAGESDRSVLLVDGDNAKPELLARLGVAEEGPGFLGALANAALDPESLVLETDVHGLTLLPAGPRERKAPELLASARARDVLERLLAADPRRIVLIDSSPALAASATGALAAHVGQALVIVKADTTTEAELKETLDLLSPCANLSLVLNSAAFQVGVGRRGKYEEYP
jgi:Mrp family chromosome partitioning ATPase